MFGHRLAVHEHVAGVRVEQADDVLDQHALAGARRAEHHRDLVVGEAEVEAVEDPRAAELLDDVDDLDRVLAAVVALLAGVPAVGVRLLRVDAGDRVVLVQVAELGRRLLVVAARRRRADLVGEAVVLVLAGRSPDSSAGCSSAIDSVARRVVRIRGCSSAICLLLPLLSVAQPPIGALGLAPQKTSVPIIPMMCTKTMLSTIDFAVAVPTPTGPPEAV